MADEEKPKEATEIIPPAKPRNPNLRGAWPKGVSGNPRGRAAGSQNKATLIARQMIEGDSEKVIRKCIDMALEGDPVCMKLIVERILPPMKDKPVKFQLPADVVNADLSGISAALLKAVSLGALSPSEATAISQLMASHRLNVEAENIRGRLSRLETFMGVETTETTEEEDA